MLGLVSLFMDISSEMIHGLLPVFLVTTLGASALAVGVIDGIAEGTASVMRLFSGIGSDRMRRRKPLTLIGYGLAALTKPLFPLAHSVLAVLVARFIDRIGKGIRTAPRDALIADLTEPSQRGAAFGLRQSLDTIGAVTGPLIAIALMQALNDDMRFIFALAVIPAFIAVAILAFGVREPERVTTGPAPRFDRAALRRLPKPFWLLIGVNIPFTLARFSEAFLILRAQSLGLTLALVPATLVVMNVAYTVTAYPAGKLSDRMSRVRLMAYGCLVLLAAQACLGFGATLAWAAFGTALWGVHLGLTEGLIAAMVADHAPADLRGTAFGVLHLVRGVLLLAGSALAGLLWTLEGPAAAFAAGGAFTLVTLMSLRAMPALRAH